ncbi:MAG: ABC transporter permease [Lachnospiraceae bacterium]|jgi:putative ABC transport system permease protein|nr:ABC transporter permease [Lachnospiraceae bacterium]
MASLINALPGAVAQGLIWGIMAIGVYLTYRILDVADLTVDGSLCTGGAVCIMLMLKGQNVWVAMFGALLAGMAAGLATGILHTFMGIPAILAGILTQLGLYSVNLKIMGKANQAINVDKYPLLVSLRFIKGVSFFKNTIFLVAAIIIVLILVLYWFFGTELGCSLRATGCNDKMARAQGINTDFARVLGLMLSNGLVAFSGALLGQYQGFSDINMGRGAIVIGLAAVIIGEAIFGKVFHNFGFRLLGVALGSIVYYLVLQVVIWLGVDTDLLKLLSALVVAVFLAIPTWKSRYFKRGFRNTIKQVKPLLDRYFKKSGIGNGEKG